MLRELILKLSGYFGVIIVFLMVWVWTVGKEQKRKRSRYDWRKVR